MPDKRSTRAGRRASPRPPVAKSNTAATEETETASTAEPVDDAATVTGSSPAAPRRRIERVSTTTTGPAGATVIRSGSSRGSRRPEFAALESDDAAIPIDRVPYVPADLRRVAAMALLMLVLIIVAGYAISHAFG